MVPSAHVQKIGLKDLSRECINKLFDILRKYVPDEIPRKQQKYKSNENENTTHKTHSNEPLRLIRILEERER